MNRKKTKQYLLRKDAQWQKVFCALYLAQSHLCDSDLIRPFCITDAVRFCQSENDFIALWELIDFVDESDDIMEAISDIYFMKPMPWQYDFVALVSKESGLEILQRLDMDAVTEAYCAGLVCCDVQQIAQKLDAEYARYMTSMRHKSAVLKRNLLLELEGQYGQKTNVSFDDISFREILQLYENCTQAEGLINAVRRAQTENLRWQSKELDCLAFAYFSPFFCDEVHLAQNKLPDSCLFANVYDFMASSFKMWQHMHRPLLSAEDLQEDALSATHDAVFVDPTEECVIDVHLEKSFYANVYIQRYPVGCLKDELPDFAMVYRGYLFTVEYVDSFADVPVAANLLRQVREAKEEIGSLERLLDNFQRNYSGSPARLRERQAELQQFINNCYCVYV